MSLFLRNGATTPTNYIYQSAALVTAYPFTAMAWIRPSSPALTERYALTLITGGAGQRSGLGVDQNNAFFAVAGDITRSVNSVIRSDRWTHILCVAPSSTDRRVYVDGGNMGQRTNGKALSQAENASVIGATTQGGVPTNVTGFTGQIAEVAVWNAALTLPQIQALAQGESPLDFSLANIYYYSAFLIGLRPRLRRVPLSYTFVGPVSINSQLHPRLPGLVQSKRDYFMPRVFRTPTVQGTAALNMGSMVLAATGTAATPSVLEEGFGTRAVTLTKRGGLHNDTDQIWADVEGRLRFGKQILYPAFSVPAPITSRTLVQSDEGTLQLITGTVTLTLPTILIPGTRVQVVIKTAGSSCTFVAGAGASILSKNNYTKLNTPGAEALAVYAGDGLWTLISNDLVSA